jgi:hypothetical protein
MIKTALKNFTAELARKRREVTRLQEDLGDLLDHLAAIEAREVRGWKALFDGRSEMRAGHLSRSDPVANQGTTKAAFATARAIPACQAGLRRTVYLQNGSGSQEEIAKEELESRRKTIILGTV